ncbi:hypothetical protein F5Y06DRAFT_29699 [Hypoxylon sp. FL0890]|nr:hypothetical protein F5Y06DRAFT_29699 [Hypoxylon sp. FL0890]
MKAIISLLLGVITAGVTAKVECAKNTSAVVPDGYTLVPFSMKGVIEPGGEVMEFNGTITDIFKQIQGIKPDFKWGDLQSTTPRTGRRLSKRSKSHIDCNVPNVERSVRVRFLFAHDYLKLVHQSCEIGGGPRKCAVLYCEDQTTVWMCNDNTDSISRDCAEIADYVLDLLGDLDCADRVNDTEFGEADAMLRGQEFDTDGFSVAVGNSGCN